MALFRQLQMSFWSDIYVGDLSPNEKLLYVYLMTNEHTRQCGVYELDIRYVVLETGLDAETVKQGINKLVKDNKIKYSTENREVLMINWLKYNSARSPKVAAVVDKEIKEIKTPEFESEVIMRSKELGYPIKIKNSPTDTVPIDYPYSTDSLPIGVRNNNNNNNHNNNNKEKKQEAPADDVQQTVFEFYEQNFGTMSGFVIENVMADIKDFSGELVLEAMKRAKLNQSGYRYAQGILKKWESDNVKNLSDVEANDVQYQNNKARKSSYSREPVVKDSLPDWAKKQPKPQQKSVTVPDSKMNEEIDDKLAMLRKNHPKED